MAIRPVTAPMMMALRGRPPPPVPATSGYSAMPPTEPLPPTLIQEPPSLPQSTYADDCQAWLDAGASAFDFDLANLRARLLVFGRPWRAEVLS
jgi:hypothetical protein